MKNHFILPVLLRKALDEKSLDQKDPKKDTTESQLLQLHYEFFIS